jgi:hypothetical protein
MSFTTELFEVFTGRQSGGNKKQKPQSKAQGGGNK